ncbi:RtcB family protein [Pseudarthrobacter oxydans]|uniref:3'-phosphate/5'-hydroxy nucleic acid ligase n=1 Tax=Pseudarthrobacter oxydans TaxID=1671 RepID=A0AAW8N6D2_PSEOX|nr:RtcB family protein [Pseudarthrobacter oxydans]MDR6791061.1 tRNA-splicing ligase RtcB [Pseudarthrobacter oxydans]MDR7162510.1 tRNA-splicing ligase RtcB [Pseudarthrobacter oxydans]
MEAINSKLLNWASILDDKTREQAVKTSQLPFIYPHLALMPDAHLGKGATVGSVIPTLNAIMPAAVGVDIGCGMIAVRTQYSLEDLPKDRKRLREDIERAIPLSAGHNNRTVQATAEPRIAELKQLAARAGFNPAQYVEKWDLQLGSLGSGNHFIEVCADEADAVWLFLHSGSRGVGNKIAQHHIGVARHVVAKKQIHLPDPDLAYLEEGTPQFDRYMAELHWAQHFALLNREEMMDRVSAQFGRWAGGPVQELERVNCHHNFTRQEVHYGKSVWVSRKGAIKAAHGDPGLIPGSMGTSSYVVEGLGNAAALNSSPHGAGREYSRNAARKTFSLDELKKAMRGIEFRASEAFIDEIPAAYKPIDVVMQDAADLVTVRHKLRQLVNVKGN